MQKIASSLERDPSVRPLQAPSLPPSKNPCVAVTDLCYRRPPQKVRNVEIRSYEQTESDVVNKGQDIDAGTHIGAPAVRLGTEAGRSTEQVKLRLRPEDALRLRVSARESHVDLSSYVALLLDDPERAAAARIPTSEFPLADVSRLAGVLGLLPEEVRRSRGELGRAFGLLKHLFEMPATATNAERHAFALAEATRDARAAIENVDAAVDRLMDELAAIREDLAVTARRLAYRP